MTTHFTFRWRPKGSQKSNLVVFTTEEFDRETFILTLDEDHRKNLYPDAVVVLVPATRSPLFKIGLQKMAAGGSSFRFNLAKTPINLIAFDERGSTSSPISVTAAKLEFSSNWLEEVKRAGLLEIFRERDVLVRPGSALHFVHPNGDHSRGFLRAANALVKGAEVSFIAMSLLSYLAFNPKRIWIDSSTIASIAYSMVSLRQSIEQSYTPPPIESFSSYSGARETKFEHPDESLVLISATASGRLAQLLIQEHRLRPALVVNLFSSAKAKDKLTVLCDVSGEEQIRENGQSLLLLHSEADCPFCHDGSPLIRFVGDQFLANAITYTPHMIVAKDAPSSLDPTMKSLARKGLFKLRTVNTNSDVHDLWIDIGRLIPDVDVDKALFDLTARYVPASVSHLVHLGDSDSRKIGELIAHNIKMQGGRSVAIVPATEASEIKNPKAVVIASGCIGSGSALQAVSRDLRDVLKERPRIYLGVAAKRAEAERQKAFRSDLTYNAAGHKHECAFIHELSLPPATSLTSWMKELKVIDRIVDDYKFDIASKEEQEYFNSRQEILSRPEIGGHDFFLPDATGRDLQLRDGFAFWPKIATIKGADQGDVLATIGALLHHMRTSRDKGHPEPKISHTEFHCTVLSPGIFGRYNDGVIQAAFLRLAYPHELDFRARQDLSAEMRRIIERCLDRYNDTQGEACAEFVLALATRRLSLQAADLKKLKQYHSAHKLLPGIKRLFDYATDTA